MMHYELYKGKLQELYNASERNLTRKQEESLVLVR